MLSSFWSDVHISDAKVALIPFITAGDPDLVTTAEALKVLDSCGCDIIELGVPYSDPLADGPVIQVCKYIISMLYIHILSHISLTYTLWLLKSSFLSLGGCHTLTCKRYQLWCNHLNVERGRDTACISLYTYVVPIKIHFSVHLYVILYL